MKLLCTCGHRCSSHDRPSHMGACMVEGCACQAYSERNPYDAPIPMPMSQPRRDAPLPDDKTLWKVMYTTRLSGGDGQVWVDLWRSRIAPTFDIVQGYWFYLMNLPIVVDNFRVIGGFNPDTQEKHIVVIP